MTPDTRWQSAPGIRSPWLSSFPSAPVCFRATPPPHPAAGLQGRAFFPTPFALGLNLDTLASLLGVAALGSWLVVHFSTVQTARCVD